MEGMRRPALRVCITPPTTRPYHPSSSHKSIQVNQREFHNACNNASEDAVAAASDLIRLGGSDKPLVLCELAYQCLTGPVGRVGSRSSLRTVANIILDQVILEHPLVSRAHCLKGQALIGPEHGGWADANLKEDCIEKAYLLFSEATERGNFQGMYLKGRLLVTSTPMHGSTRMAAVGLEMVKKAAIEGRVAQAFVFVATCYEFPEKYAPSLFTSLSQHSVLDREKAILQLYNRAAELGYAPALNDIGTSVELAYAGIHASFDQARRYYLRAAKGGYIDAFENLGNLYETGMGNQDVKRIDMRKALHFYHLGAHMRSLNCALYLATLYDEGVENLLQRNVEVAERLYVLSIFLAHDKQDDKTASAALKDLCRCYITTIKTNCSKSEDCRRAQLRINKLVGSNCVARMMSDVEKCLVRALRERKKAPLEKLVHARNSGRILRSARELLRSADKQQGEEQIVHMFGRLYAREMVHFGLIKTRSRSLRSRH